MNATHLFESGTSENMPPSSEHFWTTVFVMFLSYLSLNKGAAINVWECKFDNTPPWYKRRGNAEIFVDKLAFDSFAVEPTNVSAAWSNLIGRVDIRISGISPDILIKLQENPPRYAIIENKINSGAKLEVNQETAYPELIEYLKLKGVECQFFLLQPVGCSETLYNQAKKLQKRLGPRMGILFWEDIFRKMADTKFRIGYIDFGSWMRFTSALDTDCEG